MVYGGVLAQAVENISTSDSDIAEAVNVRALNDLTKSSLHL